MGRPKAWLPVEGEPMLARMVRIVRVVTAPVVVVAAPEQELPEIGDALVLRDSVRGHGPLEGLAIGLGALQPHVEWAWAVATDMPALSATILTRLWSMRGGAEVVMPLVEGWRQPWAALYRTALAASVRELLQEGETRPRALLERCRVRECVFGPEDEAAAWQNLNTPEEYARWQSE
jgi:molybdopterin-guanine dinucleotide biosynthesis protein A